MNDPTQATPALPQFMAQLQRLSAAELRFVVEALHDGAQLARHEAQAFPDDAEPCTQRATTLDELWSRLLSDVNTRLGHAQAAE